MDLGIILLEPLLNPHSPLAGQFSAHAGLAVYTHISMEQLGSPRAIFGLPTSVRYVYCFTPCLLWKHTLHKLVTLTCY